MGRFVVKDTYYKKAKQEGYRARSVYKLQEIQQKFRVIRRGDCVLDLGAAPGSWLQVESQLVGDDGLVLGIDILPIPRLDRKNIVTVTADIRELEVRDVITRFSIPAFDVVTCDIAPNLSGIRDVDNANIADLFSAVKGVVDAVLRQGGNFIIKSFFGEDFKAFLSEMQKRFTRVTVFKPASSRGVSSEVYFVCLGKKA